MTAVQVQPVCGGRFDHAESKMASRSFYIFSYLLVLCALSHAFISHIPLGSSHISSCASPNSRAVVACSSKRFTNRPTQIRMSDDAGIKQEIIDAEAKATPLRSNYSDCGWLPSIIAHIQYPVPQTGSVSTIRCPWNPVYRCWNFLADQW